MNTNNLVKLAADYSSHTGLTQATVSTYAANDGKFFKRLEDGSSCTIRTADKLGQWFSDHWPEDLEWPRDIARPPVTLQKRKAS